MLTTIVCSRGSVLRYSKWVQCKFNKLMPAMPSAATSLPASAFDYRQPAASL
jgi:hypothetical protein